MIIANGIFMAGNAPELLTCRVESVALRTVLLNNRAGGRGGPTKQLVERPITIGFCGGGRGR